MEAQSCLTPTLCFLPCDGDFGAFDCDSHESTVVPTDSVLWLYVFPVLQVPQLLDKEWEPLLLLLNGEKGLEL